MFEKVLFATDFSEYARKTLECIGEIPGMKEIILLHVVDATHYSKMGWTHTRYVEDAKIRLEEQKEHLKGLGLEVKTIVEVITEGDIPHTILDMADKEKVSLIVIGAKGKSIISELLLGGVSLNVLRLAKTHVLLMRYRLADSLEGEKLEKFCNRIFSRALCATDFSRHSIDTLSFIKGLGIKDIVLIHVVTKGDTQEEIDINIQETRKKLNDIKQKMSKFNIKDHVRVGNPAEEIISVAEEEDVSLIVMNARGEGWFKELLFGSTIYDVVKNAKRPILVVNR